MGLSTQVQIYNFDTGDFYSNREKRLHELNHKLRSERNKLINGHTEYSRNKKHKRVISGTKEIEKRLAEEFGIDDSELKSIIKKNNFKDYKEKLGDDWDAAFDLVCQYAYLKDLIDMKNKKAKEAKDKLLSIMTHKADTNCVRKLRDDAISDNKIISVFESTFTRTIGAEPNKLSEDFMIIKVFYFDILRCIIKNGFMYNGERYVYFTSSAGQIRTKKCVFVRESTWKKHEKTIMCGLTLDDINAKGGNNPNKHLAYLALANSATDVWDEFDIDKTIVIDDFETEVFGTYDFIDDISYSITREQGHQPIAHTDGAGMMLPNAFGVPQKNKMVRAPFVKGLLGVFDFKKFIEEYGGSHVITDIYGKEHDLFSEDIQVIFTKSQFKLWKYYNDWNDYKQKYHKYNCTTGYTNEEEDRIKNATINYQMLQTMTDITDDEIIDIAGRSIGKLKNICSSIDNIKNIFDITPYNTNKTAFQKCIELYPELLNDEYAKSHLRRIKDSIIKKCKAGKLDVNGKYTFILPDFYAACEHWFLDVDNPNGLLEDGEVFCWLFRKDDELDCLRSPHLMLEHSPRKNVACRSYGERQQKVREWFCTDAVYTSCKDFISRILQFDVDGDKSLVVADKTIIDVAKRNIDKFDVVPLYYDMKKAEAVHLDSDSVYNGLNAAFTGGNIGIYSNNISKIWNSDTFVNGTHEEQMDAVNLIKLLCAENNYVIDYAKTLYKPTRPDDINDKINEYTNRPLPHFFKYAKDKADNQVCDVNMSFVNKLESIIPNPRINFRKLGLGEIDYRLLMNNPDIEFDVSFTDNGRIVAEETDPLIVEYCKFNKEYYLSIDNAVCSGKVDKSDAYMRAQLKNARITNEIKTSLSQFGYSDIEIADILVKYLYGVKKSANKTALWLCYGDIIYENLSKKIKLGKKTIQCVDCGEWFEVSVFDSATERCEECQIEHKKMLKREQNRRAYLKKKNSVSTL